MDFLMLLLVLIFPVNADTTGRPPSITKQPQYDVFFTPGFPLQLPCEAKGSPQPTFSWIRNGRLFEPDGRRVVLGCGAGTLTFTSIRKSDEGLYQCLADNRYGRSISTNVNLRSYKLEDFDYEWDTSVYHPVGQPLTLTCDPPESVPPAEVFWVVKKRYGGFDQVVLDDRVTMDQEYGLRFAYLKRSDAMEGKGYACMAINRMRRKSTTGRQYFIHPQGETETVRSASYLWATPDDSFGLLGDNLTLKCIFAGNPSPDVWWERTDGKAMPGVATTRDFGRELFIEHLQSDDAGTYRCLATNNVTTVPVHRDIHFRVESRPTWVVKPSDLVRGVQETASITCQADGTPKPQITWSVNGVLLDYVTDPRLTDGRFQNPSPDKIVFSSLTPEDSMVIQCIASNEHGYILSDFFLRVSDDNILG